MPERKGPESRWSSAREREERNRQRAAEREAAKRARLSREAEPSPVDSGDPDEQRPLTDEERRTIRQYRFPSSTERDKTAPAAASAPTSVPDEGVPAAASSTPRRTTSGTSTRWRDSAPPPPDSGGGPGLPDLPGDGDGSGGRKRPGNSRLLIFGIGLFALMALIAFLPFGPFGGDDETPKVPTPSATLPSILTTIPADSGAEATSQAEQPVAGQGQPVVCIDPGHGGWDTGWNRTDLGDDPYSSPIVTEAELNLGMSYMLKEILEDEGIFVVMTRPSGAAVNIFDEDINGDGQKRTEVTDGNNAKQAGERDELQARINVCNEANADILISVHINGVEDRSARGYEIIYTAERDFGKQNEELATLIYRQLDSMLRDSEMGGTGRGWKADSKIDGPSYEFGSSKHYLMTGPAVPESNITPSEMPGVIVEAAFLSNDQDAGWIVQPDNQRIVVQAYAQGILDYFERNPVGS